MPGTQVMQQGRAIGLVQQPQPAMRQDEGAESTAHGSGQTWRCDHTLSRCLRLGISLNPLLDGLQHPLMARGFRQTLRTQPIQLRTQRARDR